MSVSAIQLRETSVVVAGALDGRTTTVAQQHTAAATDDRTGTIDVAIVAYRGWELTRSCLEHLRRQTVAHNVFLCDNGCDQGTAERVRAGYPEVAVMRMGENMPYPVACNAAVAAGSGEVVVMLNNDVDARPDFLERLIAPFASRPRLGSVAPLLLRPGERRIDSVGLVADPTLAAFPRFKGRPPGEARDGGFVLTGPDGAAAAFRRAAWEEVEGLNEAIFGYMDDFDLMLRLRIAGWEATAALDAVAVHIGSATYGHRSSEQRRKAGFGRAYLLRRYGVLRSRALPRTLLTEAIVAGADALLSRDLAALAGRRAGWRAAAGCPPLRPPPPAAIDHQIGFLRSMRLRRTIYMR
jgi:N-acetylglucosaminyl-diphospho-decaprenol L-rhamnosyltransferase